MILDKQTLFSDGQAVTATAVSTNTYDLGVARDLGIGDTDLELFIKVTAAFVGGTSIQFAYITSANADLSSANVIVQTPAIVTADLVAGYEPLRIQIPALSKAAQLQRYIGVSYTVVGTFTGGTLTAGVILEPREGQVYYASGLNVGGF